MMGDLHIVARSIVGGNLPGQRLQRRTVKRGNFGQAG